MSIPAIRIEMNWDGLGELEKYLRVSIPNAFDASMIEALQKAAYDGKNKAVSLVPVDTGALRQSIRVERLAKESKKIYYTGIRAGGYIRNPKTQRLVDYQWRVEGPNLKGWKREFGSSRSKPQPFIRPAMEYAMRRLPNYFWSALSKRVEVK